jgi:hypothetical protein
MFDLKFQNMTKLSLLLVFLFAANCADRPKTKILTNPNGNKPNPSTTNDELIINSSIESFMAASLARYSLRNEPFKTVCGAKLEVPANGCVELIEKKKDVKILNFNHCKETEMKGEITYYLIEDSQTKKQTLRISGDDLAFKTALGKIINRTQELTVEISENCEWTQKTTRDGLTYEMDSGVYSLAKDEMKIKRIGVEFGSNQVSDGDEKANGLKAKKDLALTEVVLNWKAACPHPPTGNAKYKFYDSALKEPLVNGEINSKDETIAVATGSNIKTLNWTSKCTTSSSTGEMPIGSAILQEL